MSKESEPDRDLGGESKASAGDEDDRADAKESSSSEAASPVKPEVDPPPLLKRSSAPTASPQLAPNPNPRSSFSLPKAGERPPAGKLLGYTQTYLIWKDKGAVSLDRDGDGKDATEDQCEHEVLFRCGNWCYTGHVVLNRDISLADMPTVIPILQRQQSRLHYYCNGKSPSQPPGASVLSHGCCGKERGAAIQTDPGDSSVLVLAELPKSKSSRLSLVCSRVFVQRTRFLLLRASTGLCGWCTTQLTTPLLLFLRTPSKTSSRNGPRCTTGWRTLRAPFSVRGAPALFPVRECHGFSSVRAARFANPCC